MCVGVYTCIHSVASLFCTPILDHVHLQDTPTIPLQSLAEQLLTAVHHNRTGWWIFSCTALLSSFFSAAVIES